MHTWLDEAPSNIALIKYMGKLDSNNNLPSNASLSYTLNHLVTKVSLELSNNTNDSWEPLISSEMPPITLSADAQMRFLKHFTFLKSQFNIKESFIIKSNNNFPHSSGIASSASSFAALTKCAVKAFSELTNCKPPTKLAQANLSRIGSGSSCRSFFSPWVIWDNDKIQTIEIPYPKLNTKVIIINRDAKQISSSKAHRLVTSSPLYADRKNRADTNFNDLKQALESKNWQKAYEVCWTEFQDMHQLFSTSTEPFAYITDATKDILNKLQDFWQKNNDGPIITMDAGPNIHLLYRPSQKDLEQEIHEKYLKGKFDVI
jgi:diphosphomevalonate decarboxylase